MKVLSRAAFDGASPAILWDSQDPIREELFGPERLEDHARSLAVAQIVSPRKIKGQLLARRLADNRAVLLAAYLSTVRAINDGRAITPASEWLVDNYHLVEKQIHEIRSDLPPGYYRQLPKLATGPFKDYPRVFGIAWAFVAHTDSRFDSEMLVRFVTAYQEVQPLTIGELWAVSITLRIVLVENLGRLARQITKSRGERQRADGLADRLLGAGGAPAESVAIVLAAEELNPLSQAFAVQLVHRLRDQDPKITPALTWLDERMAIQDTTTDLVVRDVHREQGAANVSVRNIITSLRLISDVDWKQLFERLSLVDAVLACDSDFESMDFPTRTLYRSAIEDLSRGSNRTELDIASAAVLAAKQAEAEAPAAEQARRRDTGYILLAGGRRPFEKAISYRLPTRSWAARLNRSTGLGGYLVAISAVAAILLAAPLLALSAEGVDRAVLGVLAALGAIPAIDAAVALVNRAVNLGFAATLLPALELRDSVPSHLRTLVAVPTLLTTLEGVEALIERLEIHHLASPEGDLHFALVTDWTDAASQRVAGDAPLVVAAAEGVARLNLRYGPAPGGPRFLLLHRRRVWNEGEARWIGWERKRGKLHELNRLLRAATDTTFMDVGFGTPAAPPGVRYVVTLDTDTRLPRDAVRRLIGKMAHPLNRPRLDADGRRVVEGYAVLQPRITPSLPIGREGSLFQRIFSSVSGIDPYASAVSDVYQDLFGEGSYAGKGIYDVDAFEAALANRAPELHPSQPRPLRRRVRARWTCLGCRSRRGIPCPLRRRRHSAPPLGARRLAVAALDIWARARAPGSRRIIRPTSGDRTLENVGQSPSNALGACRSPRAACRLDPPASRRIDLDGIRRPDDRAADAHSGCRRHSASPLRGYAVEPFARGRRRRRPRIRSLDADRRLPGGSGVAHGRCDRPDALAPRREPTPSARMDPGGADGERSSSRPRGFRAPNGWSDGHWRDRGDCWVRVAAWILADRASLRCALDGFACRRALCEPVAWRVGGAADERR